MNSFAPIETDKPLKSPHLRVCGCEVRVQPPSSEQYLALVHPQDRELTGDVNEKNGSRRFWI
jgi:hypothetical protein